MSTDVYRVSKLPSPPPFPRRDLVYEAIDRDKDRGTVMAWFQLFSGLAILGVSVAALTSPTAGLLATIAAAVLALVYRRSSIRGAGALLRVDRGQLLVYSRDGRTERARVRLRDLADVILDVKTIQRVQDGDSAIPAVRFAETRVGPEVDVARIVLVGCDKDDEETSARLRVQLTDAYFAHMDATEWLGKIRVFLRKHGWLPLDEREEEPTPKDRASG